MTLTVTHGFVSNIADDPKAAAAGEVLPSHWNANHAVSGTLSSTDITGLPTARKILSANITYYVRTTGSDSNGGTNSSTDAWATIQHAMDFIAGSLDIAGFLVTIDIGAGTFVGVGLKSTVGGGAIQITGAGSANTTIGPGPNDGVYSFGECVGGHVACGSLIWVDNVNLAPSLVGGADGDCIGAGAGNNINLATAGTGTINDIQITPDAGGAGAMLSVYGAKDATIGGFGPLTFNGNGSAIAAFYGCDFGTVSAGGISTTVKGTSDTAANGLGWAFTAFDGRVVPGSFTLALGASVTGPRYLIVLGSGVSSGGVGVLGPHRFPGDSEGIVDGSSFYDGFIGSYSGASLPSTSDFPDQGTGGYFKDTGSGAVYAVFNDGGTIKSVALTT